MPKPKQIMKAPNPTFTDYLLHYTILFLSSALITIAVLLLPVAFPELPLLLISAAGGAALYLLLNYFARSFRPIPVLISLLPLLLLSAVNWYISGKISAADLAAFWNGLPIGAIATQLFLHWYKHIKRKHLTTL
jgi:hypothetical protein